MTRRHITHRPMHGMGRHRGRADGIPCKRRVPLRMTRTTRSPTWLLRRMTKGSSFSRPMTSRVSHLWFRGTLSSCARLSRWIANSCKPKSHLCIVLAGAADIFRRSLEFGHPNAGTVHSRLGEALYKLALAQAKPELTAELLQAYEHFNLGAPNCPSAAACPARRASTDRGSVTLALATNCRQSIRVQTAHYLLLTLLTQLSAMVQRSRWSHSTRTTGCCEAAASS